MAAQGNKGWLYSADQLRRTPSCEDGLKPEVERRYRSEGVSHMHHLASPRILNLSTDTVATGALYFHRFYMHQSFKDFDRVTMATCCLFLACKTHDKPQRPQDRHRGGKQRARKVHLDDILRASYYTVNPHLAGGDRKLTEDDKRVKALKEEFGSYEGLLLPTLNFEFTVDLPYPYLQILLGRPRLFTRSLHVINTIMGGYFGVRFHPALICCAAIQYSSKEMKDKADKLPAIIDGKPWWAIFQSQFEVEFNAENIEEVRQQIVAQIRLERQWQQEQQRKIEQDPASAGAAASDTEAVTPTSSSQPGKRKAVDRLEAPSRKH